MRDDHQGNDLTLVMIPHGEIKIGRMPEKQL
jgi:hypothetical protein